MKLQKLVGAIQIDCMTLDTLKTHPPTWKRMNDVDARISLWTGGIVCISLV